MKYCKHLSPSILSVVNTGFFSDCETNEYVQAD